MEKISFTNIDVSKNSKITALCTTNDSKYTLNFESNQPIEFSNDSIALTLATLCGNKYDSIFMDIDMSSSTYDSISEFTKAELSCPDTFEEVQSIGKNSVLSFSGGFDSLACKYLMPDDTQLVAIDFGGWFTREKDFFVKYDPLVISTNVRMETPLARNSWAFMAIGALLTSKHFETRTHTFGTTLSTEIMNIPRQQPTLSLFYPLGIQEASYVRSLPDIGTARVAIQGNPDVIIESLHSLAGVNDPKRFRKAHIAKFVGSELGIDFNIPDEYLIPKTPLPFGVQMYEDLALIYIAHRDPQMMEHPAFSSIPSELMNDLKGISLEFFNRFAPDPYEGFPEEHLKNLFSQLANFGIKPYTSTDWENLYKFREVLRKYY